MVSFAGAAPVPAEACCPAATATRAAMPNDTRNGAEIRGRFIAQPPRMTAPSRSRRSRGLAACLRFGQTPAGTRTENVKTRRELTRNVLLLTDRYSRTARGRPAHPRLPHGRGNRCCNAPLLVTPQYGQADRLCATRDSPVAADPARHQPAHPLVLPRHSSLSAIAANRVDQIPLAHPRPTRDVPVLRDLVQLLPVAILERVTGLAATPRALPSLSLQSAPRALG